MTSTTAQAMTEVPATVSQAAGGKSLGNLQQVFQPGKRWRLIISIGVLALMFGGLAGVGMAQTMSGPDANSTVTAICVTVLVLSIGMFLLVLASSPVASKKARERKIFVFDNGYVRVTRSGPEARRWDEVRVLYQSIVTTRYNGISTGTNYAYELRFADGMKATFGTFATDMATFGPLLQEKVSGVQLDKAKARLDSGGEVDFGPYLVTPEGISVGTKRVTWPELRGLRIDRGYVFISSDKASLPSRPVQKIPNFGTFLTVVQYMRENSL